MTSELRESIAKRWRERIVPKGYDRSGAQGAKDYLLQYGQNLSKTKLIALMEYAYEQKAIGFADQVRQELFNRENHSTDKIDVDDLFGDPSVTRLSITNVHLQIKADYERMTKESGFLVTPQLIEAPIRYLAKLKAGSRLGKLKNRVWLNMPADCMGLVVRTVLVQEKAVTYGKLKLPAMWLTGNCEILINEEIPKRLKLTKRTIMNVFEKSGSGYANARTEIWGPANKIRWFFYSDVK